MMPWQAPGPYPAVAGCPSGLIHCLGSLVAYGCHLCTQIDGAVKYLIYSPFLSLARVSGIVLSAQSSISRAGYSTGFNWCLELRSQTSASYGSIPVDDVCAYIQLFFPVTPLFFLALSHWVVPEAHAQQSSVNIWGTHLLIHFSCQLHTEWGEDLFPPSAEPSLSTESNPALSLLGSFSVLHFYSQGIFFFAHVVLSCEYVISLSHIFFYFV